MSDVQDMVQQQIKDHKVMVFSKTYCPYCKKAKNVLAKYNIKSQDYGVLELDTLSDSGQADAIQQYMKSLTGASSVPRVFIGGKFIGGGDDTEKLHQKGELKNMLEAAGVNVSG